MADEVDVDRPKPVQPDGRRPVEPAERGEVGGSAAPTESVAIVSAAPEPRTTRSSSAHGAPFRSSTISAPRSRRSTRRRVVRARWRRSWRIGSPGSALSQSTRPLTRPVAGSIRTLAGHRSPWIQPSPIDRPTSAADRSAPSAASEAPAEPAGPRTSPTSGAIARNRPVTQRSISGAPTTRVSGARPDTSRAAEAAPRSSVRRAAGSARAVVPTTPVRAVSASHEGAPSSDRAMTAGIRRPACASRPGSPAAPSASSAVAARTSPVLELGPWATRRTAAASPPLRPSTNSDGSPGRASRIDQPAAPGREAAIKATIPPTSRRSAASPRPAPRERQARTSLRIGPARRVEVWGASINGGTLGRHAPGWLIVSACKGPKAPVMVPRRTGNQRHRSRNPGGARILWQVRTGVEAPAPAPLIGAAPGSRVRSVAPAASRERENSWN